MYRTRRWSALLAAATLLLAAAPATAAPRASTTASPTTTATTTTAAAPPAATASSAVATLPLPGFVHGIDVSAWDGVIDWRAARAGGARFALVKATEGVGYVSSTFAAQYRGAARAGLFRGAFHFALPNRSYGRVQADYFLAHGGARHADGRTFPGALDLEWNPYAGGDCYGKTPAQLVRWIRSFDRRYAQRTGRHVIIYAGHTWWTYCTGNTGAFAHTSPLWIAHYTGTPGPLPYNWTRWTFWQYAGSGTLPGDQNVVRGGVARLRQLARR